MQIATFSPISNGALKSDILPTRIHVLSFGKTETLDTPIEINNKTKKVFSSTQKKIGRERVPIDYNHNSVPDTEAYKNDKEPRNIAGYGTPKIDENGLWLEDIEWTPSGKESAKNYEDLSPAPLLDENGTVIGLHSVALCPAGAISDLHFYNAPSFEQMKKSSMKLSASTDNKENKENNHIDNSPLIANLSDKDNKQLMTVNTQASPGDNDYKEQQPKLSSPTLLDNINKEDHPVYCMCDTCTKDMKEQIFTKLSYAAGPQQANDFFKKYSASLGEIHNIKTMSAVVQPNAYLTEPSNTKQFRIFMDEKIAKMASELNLPDASELEKRLKAWLAEWLGDKTVPAPITGDPKPAQFSAANIEELTERIKVLEADRENNIARFSAMEKDTIVSEATKNGKVVPFSAEEIKEMKSSTLKSIIDKLPVTVPMSAKTKILSADGKPETKKTISDSARAIQEQVEAVLANS